MSTFAVLGAGPIGAAATYVAAATGAARRVVLVDDAAAVARGLALDIRQSGPITGSDAAVEGTGDLGAILGASVILVADRHGAGGARTDAEIATLAAARTLNPRAFMVCAGPDDAGLVEHLVNERSADRRRVVASAPEALRSGATALAALEAGTSPREVVLAVVGRPPRELFVGWSGASIGGSPATDVLAPPAVSRLDGQLARLWPPGPFALAAAAVHVAARYAARTPGWSCVFLVPPADQGPRTLGVAIPAAFDVHGAAPHWPALAPKDRVRLAAVAGGRAG
ncbi:MAG: hypothetical protein AB7O28_05500 [Vicinamibacterales bacterium]